jgi:hypothetical protein
VEAVGWIADGCGGDGERETFIAGVDEGRCGEKAREAVEKARGHVRECEHQRRVEVA